MKSEETRAKRKGANFSSNREGKSRMSADAEAYARPLPRLRKASAGQAGPIPQERGNLRPVDRVRTSNPGRKHPAGAAVAVGCLSLTGCEAGHHSPTLDVLGSYFPAWMICIVIGLVLTLIARQLLIGFKLDTHLKSAPVVYVCLMILFTLSVWLMFFKD